MNAIPEQFAMLTDPSVDYNKQFAYDPAKAGKMLDEAGFPLKDGKRFALDFTSAVNADAFYAEPAAQIIAANWRAIGIDVKLSLIEGQLWTNKVFKDRNFDVSMVSLTARTDPLFGVDRSFLCNTTNVPYVNPTGYCNPDLDAIAAKAAAVPLGGAPAMVQASTRRSSRVTCRTLTLTNAKKFFAISSRFGGIDEEMDLAFNGNPQHGERLGQVTESSGAMDALIERADPAANHRGHRRLAQSPDAGQRRARQSRELQVRRQGHPRPWPRRPRSPDWPRSPRSRRFPTASTWRWHPCRPPAWPMSCAGWIAGACGRRSSIPPGSRPSRRPSCGCSVSNSRILMHGPNCMGLINLSDATPIYTGGITSRVRSGPVALIAQSGSAAISVINSSTAGFSKVVTIGSEYRVTGADYLRWFASDDDTSVIGLVLESIPDADRFADAVDRVHAAGKSMVVLKVGRSATGARATLGPYRRPDPQTTTPSRASSRAMAFLSSTTTRS